MIKTLKLIFLGIVFIMLCACATPKPEPVETGNPGKIVSQLEANLATARTNHLDVLAPSWFEKAQSSYAMAKKDLDKGARMSDIAKNVEEANESLEKAKKIAVISQTILGDTSAARQKAIDVGADKLGEPFQDVENQYLKLGKAIENDNMSYAQKNSSKVQAEFRNVEIMAIKDTALRNTRTMMADAKENKVYKIAPLAYEQAEQALKAADEYIGMNPYNTKGINEKSEEATFQARRMMSISESGSKFKDMEPEESAIYLESILGSIGKSLAAKDLRDKPAEDQVNLLIETADSARQNTESLEEQNQSYQTQIADLEQRLSALKGLARQQEDTQKKLMAEKEFNDLFNRVQASFDPSEAEVYKQGKQLVIRLRAINFPVGQAILSPENFSLLSKVQRSIRTFGQPLVTIEGHTDSTGSDQTNKALSQSRANAVKTYLVANKTLSSDKIRAMGYGAEKPLATNSSPEGRAANRRIDVVITPDNAR